MVKKFKSFEDADRDLWNFSPDSFYYKRIAGFYKLASNLSHFSIIPGVYKYKSLKEANENRLRQSLGISKQ